MTFKKNSPGCNNSGGCGCGGCQIGADTFTEADNASVPGWTQVAGTSAIVSNKLKMTANNTVVVFNTADSAGGIEVNASVDVVGANSGDQPRIFIKENNGTYNDCYVAELTIGTSNTLKLFHRTSGSDGSALATTTVTTSAGSTYTLKICYGNGKLTATETVTGKQAFASLTTNSTQLNAGLACKTIASNIQFANFTYNHGHNSSTHPTCDTCVGSCTTSPGDCCADTPPAQFDVTLPGIWGPGSYGCDCAQPSTFTVTNPTPGTANSTWNYGPIVDAGGCSFNINVELRCANSTVCFIEIFLTITHPTNELAGCTWLLNPATAPDANCDTTVWTVPVFGGGYGSTQPTQFCSLTGVTSATVQKH
jgi:hypothetical protein